MVSEQRGRQPSSASTFVDGLDVPACAVDEAGRMSYANAGWRELQRRLGDADAPEQRDSRERLQAILQQARLGGHAGGALRADGSVAVEANTFAGTGQLIITLRAHEQPQARPELFDAAPDPVVRLSPTGQIAYANAPLARLAGREQTGLLGLDFARLIAESHRPVWEQALRRASRAGTARVTLPLARSEGAPTLEILLVNDAGRGFYAYGQDKSEQLQREQRAEQAQRMDSVGNLAAGISHDFNNLLTVIQANLSEAVSASERPQQGDLPGLLREAEAAAQSAAELSRQLLAIGRSSEARREPVALAPLVEELVALLRRTIDPNVELISSIPDELLLLGSASQIQQVLFNLALNSVDALPRGGRVSFGAQREPQVAGLPPRPEGYVRIECSDNGTGMDSATAARIFEPYFTTKRTGTGLGLAMVYGIVQEHGGRIRARSAPNQGTTMVLQLPALPGGAAPTVPAPALPAAERVAPISTARSALVVDDHRDLRKVCAAILERAGYTVIEASTGDEALEQVATLPRKPDIALIDASMPGLSGPETATALLRIAPQTRVLLMSGYASENVAPAGEGAYAFLQKPFDSETLLASVDEVLG